MLTVLLFGLTFRDCTGESEIQVEMRDTTTVKNLLATTPRLNALSFFMNRGEVLVTVNRKVGSLDSFVRDGDTVKLTYQSNPTYEGAMWQNP